MLPTFVKFTLSPIVLYLSSSQDFILYGDGLDQSSLLSVLQAVSNQHSFLELDIVDPHHPTGPVAEFNAVPDLVGRLDEDLLLAVDHPGLILPSFIHDQWGSKGGNEC